MLLLQVLLFAILIQAAYCVGDMMIVVADRDLRSVSTAIATSMFVRPGGGLPMFQ